MRNTSLRVCLLSAMNYLGFGLILQSFWVAVQNEIFRGAKDAPCFSNCFLLLPTRLL